MIRMRHEIVPVIVVCCVFANAAIAEEEEAFSSIPMHKHIWQVRPEVSHFKYKEPGVMEEEGTFYGLGASYTYRPWADPEVDTREGRYLLRLEGRLAFGEVDYDGGLSDGTSYTTCNVDDTLFEFRVLGGRDFLTPASLTTLYFGFGYRYLNDDLSCDPHGYERESNYFYVPVGVQFTHGLSGEWSLTPGGEFDFLFLGLQTSHLSDLHSGYDDVTTAQHFGFGLRGSVRLQKRFARFGLAVDPFITYWNVNESDEEYSGGLLWHEPENWSLEYGLRLLVAF
jgi:hypothetical protein